MDNSVLKKRLNTFKSGKGTLRGVSNEVIVDVLRCWENWQGTSADLYRELGISKMQLVIMLKNAKKLIKSGVVTESEFREIQTSTQSAGVTQSCSAIEVSWAEGKVIRFAHIELLIEFLKKVA